jgi:hypothetical protein
MLRARVRVVCVTRGGGPCGIVLGSIVWLALCASQARAEEPLVVHALGKTSLRIDGDLRDWLGVRLTRVGQGSDASFEYGLAHDAEALYVGARVYDDRMRRTAHPTKAEDALLLTLELPQIGGRTKRTEIWLYAGIPGRQAAVAALGADGAKPSPTKAVSVVEGPLKGEHGYVLEARIPWSLLAGNEQRSLARGAIALHDVDRKADPEAKLVTTAGGRGELSPLLIGRGGNAAISAFLRAKQLESGVRYDLLGDLAGDARPERVVLAGTYAVIAGPEIRGANGDYGFLDLPVPMSSDVLDAALRDMTADGKAELVVRIRQEPDAPRVYSWDGARFDVVQDKPRPAPAAAVARTPTVEAPRVEPQAAPAQPAPPGAAELIAAFRDSQGIDPSQKPRFMQHVNVAEDARLESLMLFGKNLLVIGKGYRGGTGYFYFGLPVRDGSDIERMFTADVTGDGRDELFVRFVQAIGDVQRDLLLCYRFTEQGMTQLLGVEVRRVQGANSVEDSVELLEDHGRHALRISPARARGWSAESYPFVTESSDGYAPLLLPWKDGPVRYHPDGDRLVGQAAR